MFSWLIKRRIMTGGLYFGPPGWSPDHIEGLTDAVPHENPAQAQMSVRAGQGHAPPGAPPAALQPAPHQSRDCHAFVQLLDRAGLGGAGQTSAILPPLIEQVRALADRRIRSLVLNLLPTQPEYALHIALSRAAGGALDDVLAGLALVQGIVRARRVTVVLDRHDWHLRRIWKHAALKPGRIPFEVVTLLNKYPQAHHTMFLRALFGRKIGPHELPTQANRVIVDPVACWTLGRWVRLNLPLTARPVQLFVRSDKRDVAPRVVMGRLGETLEVFLERYGLHSQGRQVIINGMLAGEEADPSTTTIAADTESVALRARPEPENPTACIACGWCLDHCPTALNPIGLYELSRTTDAGTLQRASPARLTTARESLHCLACGLCSYVCPTRLPLTQGILELQALALRTAGAGAAPRAADPADDRGPAARKEETTP